MHCKVTKVWSAALLIQIAAVGCTNKPAIDSKPVAEASRQLTPVKEAVIVNFCSDCHVMPDPQSFPKNAWKSEVQRGYEFYYASGRTNLEVPVFADTHHYFVSRAPEILPLPKPAQVDQVWVDKFKQQSITIAGLSDCAVSFLDVVDLGEPLGRGILFSEMKHGGVYFSQLRTTGQAAAPKLLTLAGHPAVARVFDWDADGLKDLIVADLGSFLPEDHQRGRVIWLRQNPQTPGEFLPTTLHDSVGRVSAVEVADFNSDGRPDLLVAEFGWQTTGGIFWLERTATEVTVESAATSLTKHAIDARAGTIQLPVSDLNDDGHLDFVALISQHHERIEAMINDGAGNFESKLIYAAPEPAFGSSGIELVDMNNDGRRDILFTNGDSFDSFILKPSHGVRWLENKGEFPFVVHEVGKLPGAHRALVGNFGGDGSQQIAAGAFFAKDVLKSQDLQETEGLVLWRRTEAGDYAKHVLSTGDCTHAAMLVADLDSDGRDDLIVGEFRNEGADGRAFTVWLSR